MSFRFSWVFSSIVDTPVGPATITFQPSSLPVPSFWQLLSSAGDSSPGHIPQWPPRRRTSWVSTIGSERRSVKVLLVLFLRAPICWITNKLLLNSWVHCSIFPYAFDLSALLSPRANLQTLHRIKSRWKDNNSNGRQNFRNHERATRHNYEMNIVLTRSSSAAVSLYHQCVTILKGYRVIDQSIL